MASQSSAVRVLLTNPPFPDGPEKQWNSRGRWGVDWISVETPQAPFIAAYRRNFSVDSAKTIRVHVTADNRYELFLDGKLIGRGSERGDVDNWFFETYDLILEPGEHVLTAKVWTFGDRAAIAQHALRHGFLLAADHKDDAALVTTSIAPWVGRVLTGITVTPAGEAWGAGGKLDVNGSEFAWDWLEPSGGAWTEVKKVEQAGGLGVNDLSPAHSLRPALLPPMISVTWKNSKVRHVGPCVDGPTSKIAIHAADSVPSEVAAWQHFLEGGKLEIPAHTIRRVLIDHDNYLTAYHHLKTSGGKGSSIRLYWQEALFEKPDAPDKGNRDQIEGKYFTTIWDWTDGIGDIFQPDGGVGREWSSIWWHSGRYVEVLIKTADEPLVLESLRFEETRYPFESQAQFSSSDPRLASVIPIAYRTLQMCSHETYMDCPYYEQLQYVGDTRLQVLVSYVTSPDDRLPRKAMDILGESRLTMGFTQSRYPSHVRQVIPPFSLWWVGMVHDFAMWRGDMDYVLHRMPGVRGVMEAFRSLINEQGLMTAPKGWNFVDWVPGWSNGMAPGQIPASVQS